MNQPDLSRITEFNGYSLITDPDDHGVSEAIREHHVWEKPTTEKLIELLKPKMTFVDCGAHIGYYTLLASSIVGLEGWVYAFEPSPHNRAFLLANIMYNHSNNIVVYPFILHLSCGFMRFTERIAGNTGDSYIERDSNSQSPLIRSVTLDSLFQPNTVDVIKIDCQGSDNTIVEGGKRLLTESSDIKVFYESDCRSILERCGYTHFTDLTTGEGPSTFATKYVM